MKVIVALDLGEQSETGKIYSFLASYPDLSFPCSKIRRELSKLDNAPRISAQVEYSLRTLTHMGLISREGKPGHYEYKVRK
jgi:hypothetical protein